MDNINLYVVRHGQTEYNTEGRIQGWCDSPLTDKGINDALITGKGLSGIDFDAVYSSDLKRAQDTAGHILKGMGSDLTIKTDPGLRERSLGTLEKQRIHSNAIGKAVDSALASGKDNEYDIEYLCSLYDEIAGDSSTEPFEDFKSRLMNSLKNIVNENIASKNILVVSHGLSINCMIYCISKNKFVPNNIHNLSVTHIKYSSGEFSIEKCNDMEYYNKGNI